jgi:predicted nucleotidyltransferase
LSTVEVRYLKINYNEVLRKLKQYAKSTAETHKGVKTVVLTGSLAKGNYAGSSDADILIIADGLPHRVLERYQLFADTSLPVDSEPRAYSIEEFVKMIHRGDHFALEALKVGIPLYGAFYFEQLKKSNDVKDFRE